MIVNESLHFDRALDSIYEREDFGEHGMSMKLANHVLVFVAEGLLIKSGRQVLGIFLCRRN